MFISILSKFSLSPSKTSPTPHDREVALEGSHPQNKFAIPLIRYLTQLSYKSRSDENASPIIFWYDTMLQGRKYPLSWR